MIQEIIYTSAPRGLKVGSKGFCTVVSTRNMMKPLAARLEALSAYRHLLPPGDPHNPVTYAHIISPVAGRKYHVLSRIGDAGLDYSQRSNKIAHHVALDARTALQCPAGPAWLLKQPGFMRTQWQGEPGYIEHARSLPVGTLAPRICERWRESTGDAGWASILARHVGPHQDGDVYLICDPETDVLALVLEAQSLLTAQQRWLATFSTNYTRLPPDVVCRWRFVIDGTAEARDLRRRHHLRVHDLTGNLPPAPDSPAANAARTGQSLVAVSRAADDADDQRTSANEEPPVDPEVLATRTSPRARSDDEPPRRVPPPRRVARKQPPRRRRSLQTRRGRRVLLIAAPIVAVILVGAAAFMVARQSVRTADHGPKRNDPAANRTGTAIAVDDGKVPEQTPTPAGANTDAKANGHGEIARQAASSGDARHPEQAGAEPDAVRDNQHEATEGKAESGPGPEQTSAADAQSSSGTPTTKRGTSTGAHPTAKNTEGREPETGAGPRPAEAETTSDPGGPNEKNPGAETAPMANVATDRETRPTGAVTRHTRQRHPHQRSVKPMDIPEICNVTDPGRQSSLFPMPRDFEIGTVGGADDLELQLRSEKQHDLKRQPGGPVWILYQAGAKSEAIGRFHVDNGKLIYTWSETPPSHSTLKRDLLVIRRGKERNYVRFGTRLDPERLKIRISSSNVSEIKDVAPAKANDSILAWHESPLVVAHVELPGRPAAQATGRRHELFVGLKPLGDESRIQIRLWIEMKPHNDREYLLKSQLVVGRTSSPRNAISPSGWLARSKHRLDSNEKTIQKTKNEKQMLSPKDEPGKIKELAAKIKKLQTENDRLRSALGNWDDFRKEIKNNTIQMLVTLEYHDKDEKISVPLVEEDLRARKL